MSTKEEKQISPEELKAQQEALAKTLEAHQISLQKEKDALIKEKAEFEVLKSEHQRKEQKLIEDAETFKKTVEEFEASKNNSLEKKAVSLTQTKREDLVFAKKGTLEQQFSKSEWQMMGKNKEGWEEIVEVPIEVQELELTTETK